MVLAIVLSSASHSWAQFAPQAGMEGSTAIHKDSSLFISWATECAVDRGWKNIALSDSGFVGYGVQEDAVGPVDNLVVSLGDGGVATLVFEVPLADGPGWDFAIFENGFKSVDENLAFLELAFVEVSSNGIDFFRFDATSLTQHDEQLATFGVLDATKLNNLAGKYVIHQGVPFDLNEMSGKTMLDINNIVAIRLVDVVGSIEDDFASFDADGNKINDPWPTPFETGGFDLDAIGVIHNQSNIDAVKPIDQDFFTVYPNPATGHINIKAEQDLRRALIYDMQGSMLKESYLGDMENIISLEGLPKGLLVIKVIGKEQLGFHRILKQ